MTEPPSQTSPEPPTPSSTAPGLVEQPGQIDPDRTPRASPGISTTGAIRAERPSSPEDSEETRVEGGRPGESGGWYGRNRANVSGADAGTGEKTTLPETATDVSGESPLEEDSE